MGDTFKINNVEPYFFFFFVIMTTPQCKCFRAACRIHFRSVHRKKQAKTWTERRPRRCFLRDRNHPSSFSVLEGWAQYTSLNWRQKGWRRQRIHRKGSWFCSFQHSIKKTNKHILHNNSRTHCVLVYQLTRRVMPCEKHTVGDFSKQRCSLPCIQRKKKTLTAWQEVLWRHQETL